MENTGKLVYVALDIPIDDWLSATLNRFHFQRIKLVDAPQAGSIPVEYQAIIEVLGYDFLSEFSRYFKAYIESNANPPRSLKSSSPRAPVADGLADEFESALISMIGVEPVEDPTGFTIVMSHDVDVVGWAWLATLKSACVFAYNALRTRKVPDTSRFFKNLAKQFFGGQTNAYFGFDKIIDAAKELNFRPTVFFYAWLEDDNQLSYVQRKMQLNPNYKLAEPIIDRALKLLTGHDTEIGLHGSYLSAWKTGLLSREAEKVQAASNMPCTVARQHFLNLSGAETMAGLLAAGVNIESSCGYVYDNGYLCGTARPFVSYVDPGTGKQMVSVPMVFMDAVPLYFRPMGVAAVKNEIMEILNQVERSHGTVSFNFHQRFHACIPEYHDIYIWIVEETRRRGGCVKPLGEILTSYEGG